MAQATSSPYPVTIRGELTDPINRWLFLVKWLLIIPHVVVLAFLYVGLIVAWVISLFAILFTGRYPRGLFDFNVGVLRWSWRVGFYSYYALGTDKYPPFSLAKKDDYPADLDVEYPEKLSQGLVLVKWWLLAIPHYLIVGVLQGTSGYSSGGLLIVLVLIAAVVNLFTGRYPKDIWELVMGINRWGYRVCGYAVLVTDQYPPFRFGE
ncbi:DUF4389 domain-containing protein [Chloroflexota bacterium]